MWTIAGAAEAAEIAPFRLTGLEGSLDLRYLGDDYTQEPESGRKSDREGRSFEQRLYVLLHSYIYHPNFIRLDIGGGPVLFQNKFEDNQGQFNHNDVVYDFDVTMNILEKKPYPLKLYYDRKHSIPAAAARDPIAVRRTRYGADFWLRQPLVPANLDFHVGRQQSDGTGVERVIDEKVDKARFAARGELGPRGSGTLAYAWNKRRSASGSTELPIEPTTRTTNKLDIFTRHLFGNDDQLRLSNRFIWDDKHYDNTSGTPSTKQIRYSPKLRWIHSETLTSRYVYDYLNRQQEVVDTTLHRAVAGLTHLSFDDTLTTDGDVHGEINETTGLDQDRYGTRLRLRWLQPFDRMTLGLTGAWGYDYVDREASSDTIDVIGERHVLVGVVPVSLNNSFVVQNSIVASNSTRTQTFVEDLDYRVIVISDITQIQRIPTGNIEDGETVLVDYAYLSGGTFSVSQFYQNYRIDLGMYEYYRLHAQYRENIRKLRSGIPTVPLNSIRETLLGARVDYPFLDGYKVGGAVEAQDYNADIGPYDRKSADVYFYMPLVWNAQLQLFAARIMTDRHASPEDQDITRFGLRFFSRPWPRTTINADIIKSKDDGGTITTKTTRARLGLRWAYRKLSFALTASHHLNQFGGTDSKRNRIEAILSREF